MALVNAPLQFPKVSMVCSLTPSTAVTVMSKLEGPWSRSKVRVMHTSPLWASMRKGGDPKAPSPAPKE